MSKIKAFALAALLATVIFGALCSLLFIDEIGLNIFHCITAWVTGGCIFDKIEDFYKWLRKGA